MEENQHPLLDAKYWNKRYIDDQTGWDIGYANPALITYAESAISKDATILIPGAGSAYELEWLWNNGYTKAYAIDLSETVKQQFLKRVPTFPAEQYLIGDFFELDLDVDVVLEQTFFCALSPTLRTAYRNKMLELVVSGGKLAGVLFNMEKADGPPFGGSEAEYRQLFSPVFGIKTLENCRNSIPPRQGAEFFIELLKK